MAVAPSKLSPPERPAPSHSKARVLTELGVGYALIMIVIWTPRAWQRPFYLAAVAWIVLVTILSFDGAKAMGLRPSGVSPRSWWIVAAALMFALLAILTAARIHTANLPAGPLQFVKLYIGYAIWAGTQQFLLQEFFLLRLLRLLPSPLAAAFAATTLFSLAHLPNPILTPITAVWGFAACLLFLRYRNLYPLAISHAILGICVAVTIPGPVTHGMRVGLGYLRYRTHHHRSQKDQIVSTAAWVMADAPTRRCFRQARP